jgi:bifunctional UDP-N-acetylglucosamine pyrophosphorylase/glucosamine-1-phosphate N-acetyltransferase
MSARAIVLAAGKGTRMKSARPKVLHELCGRPMLWWGLEALSRAGVDGITVVTNPQLEAQFGQNPMLADFDAQTVVQPEQAGTGDAVRIALAAMPPREGAVLVTYGDMPLIDESLLRGVTAALAKRPGRLLALVTARMPLPSTFGRVVRDGKRVARIVEARDCSDDELELDEMNAGVYAYDERALREVVPRIGNANVQGEYYLTDTIALLAAEGRVVPVIARDHRIVLGINDRVELAHARTILNARLCEQHMRDGVTIVDPATTYLEAGVRIGADTIVLPGTSIGRNSVIGRGCTVGPHTRLEAATIGDGVRILESVVVDSSVGPGTTIGPFAHLRGGSRLGERVRIGNFVETKNAELADDTKANHLAYIGDAAVGARSNIGAGTITANFDGLRKNRTEIGADVKIGTNTSLVAPVTVGDGAVTGAGTVVIRDVAAGERVVGNPARPIAEKPAPA